MPSKPRTSGLGATLMQAMRRLTTVRQPATLASSTSPLMAGRQTGRAWRWLKPLLQFGSLIVATGIIVSVITVLAILPAYKNPQARMYTSSLGYAKIIRKSGGAFPVKITYAARRHFSEPILGEGVMGSHPILVPLIPIDYVTKVHVKAGQRVEKGQLLAELDPTRAIVKLESAKLAVSTTIAEANRVHIGSAYVLAQERPQQDQINLDAAKSRMKKIREQQQMYRNLYKKGIISRASFLELEKELIGEEKDAKTATFKLDMSTRGVRESLQIADNAVEDARRAVRIREKELASYKVYAPADGVIERVLVAEGEYNQDSGKPGFVIAHGLWFEAHLDQRVINRVRIGQQAKIFLEAYPAEPFIGHIRQIIPIVSFNMGGPETNRPIRPRGSGGPEWPATFVTHIELENQEELQKQARIVPGMTGFGQVISERDSIAIPLKAVSSLSAGAGYVHIYEGDDQWSTKTIRTGRIQDGYIEVQSGLDGDETIICEGFEILEGDDRIRVDNPADLRTDAYPSPDATPSVEP